MFDKKTNPWLVSTAILAGFIVGFFVGNVYTGGELPGQDFVGDKDPIKIEVDRGAGANVVPEEKEYVPPKNLVKGKISGGGSDMMLGDPDAPVTIYEFSDYQCPYCGRFYSQTLPLIHEEYIEKGKVKLIFRDFPLSFHKRARGAAIAARCAGEQDDFWGMHDMLFENSSWQQVADANEEYKRYASALGLNSNDFASCLENNDYDAQITENMQFGASKGISGTPGFLVNDQVIKGAQPFSVFKQAIDTALGEG